ncbi:MAG: hypothetical protein N2C14_28135, partial [Planctomycetales bacterium]
MIPQPKPPSKTSVGRRPVSRLPIRQPSGARYRYVRARWRAAATLIDAVGETLFAPWNWLGGRPRPLRHLETDSAEDDPRSILLVQLDHLGDAIMTSAMLPPLRARFPDARIEILASAETAEFFNHLPEVDRVRVCRRHRFARDEHQRWWPASMIWWGRNLRVGFTNVGGIRS